MLNSNKLLIAVLLLPLLALATGATAATVFSGEFVLDDLSWERSADGAYAPSLPGTHPLGDTDRYELLGRELTLLVPADFNVADLEIVPLATRRLTVPGELLRAGPQLDSEGVPGRQAIHPADKAAYPAAWGRFGGSHVMQGFRLATVTVYPLRAEFAADGTLDGLLALERFEVRLLPGILPDPFAEMAVRERYVPGERARLEGLLRSFVDNPEALAGYVRSDGTEILADPSPDKTPAIDGEAVTYLIITNAAMAPTFQDLADHRTAHGLPAVVKTVEWIQANYRNGVDIQETIRMFVREAYARWGVQYVLLGGDTDVIPARHIVSDFHPPGGHTEIPADLYFSALDGNWNADGDDVFGEPVRSEFNPGDDCDMASDVSLGRAPVSTPAQARTFVDKVIGYENAAPTAAYTDRLLFAAEVLFTDITGEIITLDGATYAEAIYENLLTPQTGMDVVRMYESYNEPDGLGGVLYPGSVRETRDAVVDSMNTGRYNIINQIGHGFFFEMSLGDLNLTVSHADGLTNSNPFMIYALNCASAAFDYSCLLERFIQNPNGGSMASIGASRAAFPSTANDFQYEFFSRLVDGTSNRVGDLVILSRSPWLAYASTNSFTRWTYMNYTLLGDPAMMIWTASPAALDVAVPAGLEPGEQLVGVDVTSGGLPVAGATVVLELGDDYAYGTTDTAGHVDVAAVLTGEGVASVTVSGPNLEASQTGIPVLAPGAYVAFDQVTVVDDGTDGSQGNGNGIWEAGERAALWVRFRETGGASASGLSANLATGDPDVTIHTAGAVVANAPASGTALATTPFLATLAADIPDGHHVLFDLTVTGASTWESTWEAVVLAPELEPVALKWYDSFYGDNDGVVESGERIAFTIDLKNFGAGLSTAVTGRLRTSDPNVTLQDTLVTYPAIALLDASQGSGLFSMTVLDVGQPHKAWVLFQDAQGRSFRHDFRLSKPGAPVNLGANSALGPDIIAVHWSPASIDDIRGYHIFRSDSETGPFVRVNTDLIDGIAYYRDSGLEGLTRYYYRVSAVDTSLVESARSDILSQSTAPAEAQNFPLSFALETDSHTAVGDVTGDGNLEIVVASDEIYVWRYDGSEVVNGDGDTQTLGPITNLATRFTPTGVALANLDDDPALEIVCCDRDNGLVHVYNSDGTELPGWPRYAAYPQGTSTSWIWATPSVGDIDGDGDNEIVVNNLRGVTMAWHHDGTEVYDGDANPATIGPLVDRWSVLGTAEWNRCSPALFDLDGDGGSEIIFGTRYGWAQENFLHAYKADGTEAAGFPVSTGFGGTIMCSPTVVDLNGDDIYEIIVVSEEDSLRVVQQDGTNYPGFPIFFRSQSVNNDYTCPSPAVGDFDGDGQLEIVAVRSDSFDECSIHVIDTDYVGGTSGQDLSGWPQAIAGISNASPVVGDINGDGLPDVIHGIGGGSTETPNELYAFTHDGQPVDGFPITLGGPIKATPVICDLDGDMDVDIVLGSWDLQVHVWDMPFAYDPRYVPWPTFQGNNLRDGQLRMVSTTAVEEALPSPSKLVLGSASPNPFNPSTRVSLYVPGDGGSNHLRVDIFDVQGRLVSRLHDGQITTGWHDMIWAGRDDAGKVQPSGVYFFRARVGSEAQTIKMSLVK